MRGRTRRIKVHCHWDVLAGTVLSGSRVNQRGAQQHLCVTEQEQPAASTRRAAPRTLQRQSIHYDGAHIAGSLFTNGRWSVHLRDAFNIHAARHRVIASRVHLVLLISVGAERTVDAGDGPEAARSPSAHYTLHTYTHAFCVNDRLSPASADSRLDKSLSAKMFQ
jgi:hypothetical protein